MIWYPVKALFQCEDGSHDLVSVKALFQCVDGPHGLVSVKALFQCVGGSHGLVSDKALFQCVDGPVFYILIFAMAGRTQQYYSPIPPNF